MNDELCQQKALETVKPFWVSNVKKLYLCKSLRQKGSHYYFCVSEIQRKQFFTDILDSRGVTFTLQERQLGQWQEMKPKPKP